MKFQGTPWIVSRCHADVIQWDCSKYPNVELLSLMTTGGIQLKFHPGCEQVSEEDMIVVPTGKIQARQLGCLY